MRAAALCILPGLDLTESKREAQRKAVVSDTYSRSHRGGASCCPSRWVTDVGAAVTYCITIAPNRTGAHTTTVPAEEPFKERSRNNSPFDGTYIDR
jgi:hypothetical protein